MKKERTYNENKCVVLHGLNSYMLDLGILFIRANWNVVLIQNKKDLTAANKKNTNILRRYSRFIGDFEYSDFVEINDLFENIFIQRTGIDCLINGFDFDNDQEIINSNYDEVYSFLKNNIVASYYISKAFMEENIKTKYSGKISIINLKSVFSDFNIVNYAKHSAASAAIESMTKTLSLEWLEYNTQVNSISLPFIRNEESDSLSNFELQIFDRTPIKTERIRSKDVFELIKFLTTTFSSKINGQNFNIDNGLSANGGWKRK